MAVPAAVTHEICVAAPTDSANHPPFGAMYCCAVEDDEPRPQHASPRAADVGCDDGGAGWKRRRAAAGRNDKRRPDRRRIEAKHVGVERPIRLRSRYSGEASAQTPASTILRSTTQPSSNKISAVGAIARTPCIDS